MTQVDIRSMSPLGLAERFLAGEREKIAKHFMSMYNHVYKGVNPSNALMHIINTLP